MLPAGVETAPVALSPIPNPACKLYAITPVSLGSGATSFVSSIFVTEKYALYTAKPVPLVRPRAIGSIYAERSSCAEPAPAVAFVIVAEVSR